MVGSLYRARRSFTLAIVALFCCSVLAPLAALADTNLEVGGTARIAYANGDDVRLRDSAGYGGKVLKYLPEGTLVDVLDGPMDDDDGNPWYQVSLADESGYIVAKFLALDDGNASSDTVSTPDDATFNPEGASIGEALIAGTNGDGVRCRSAADRTATLITVIPEGTIVELIDVASDVWQPINCGGQSGFVHTDFVSYDLSGADQSSDNVSTASADDTQFGEASVTATGFVAGTNGDGVRCRSGASMNASVITVVEEGSSLSLRGDARGDWQPVVCAGDNGYVHSDFVSFDDPGSAGASSAGDDVVGTATVSGTNGDGVRCRTGGSFSASVIVVLGEGESVSLRSGGDGDWQPVVCGGSNGFVASQYLSDGGDGDSSSGGGGDSISGSGVISGTNGDGVRCRSGAGFNASVLSVLHEGASVDLRGDAEGDWQPVYCAGSNGWVFAEFVGFGPGDADAGDDDGSGGASNSDFSAGDVAMVTGTSGEGVRLRSGAGFNASIITIVPEGQDVDVIDGSTGDWVAVSFAGTSGFILMDFLGASDGGSSGGSDSGGGGLANGEHAMTLAALNLRYDPGYSSGIAAVAPDGTVVEVTGNPSGGFYPVDWDGLQGYMSGDYLSWTDQALSSRGGSGDDSGNSGGGGGGGSSSSGNTIVDFAMQYLGYPYIWATHGPSSFDCSGFTYWVILNTVGQDIGAGTFSQIDSGSPVDYNNLQPGDLVFFQNTYTWGLSHVGIYIGSGQFIHAENESTGVVISNLGSDYYASRWYGARRIA